MLYERWRSIAEANGHETAIWEVGAQKRWTFGQLAAAAEQSLPDGAPIVFPRGRGAEFLLQVLRGWRSGSIVCPLDTGQPEPLLPSLPEHCCHLKLTSATTGQARAIVFRESQLMADVDNIVSTMGLRPDWPNIGVISMAHSYGFSNLVLPLLLRGIPLVLAGMALPEALKKAAACVPAATLPAVPALWKTWLDVHAIPGQIRLGISAGAPLPLPVETEVFGRSGLKIHNFYGSSECGGIAYDRTEDPRADAANVGSAMDNVMLSVSGDGCLQVQSSAVGERYWPADSPALRGGVFQTADVAEILGGNVFLRGRATEMINVAGQKVAPEAIEHALSAHPCVADCLVFGVPAAMAERAETIVACVVPLSGGTPELLKEHLLDRLPAWQIPREWWLLPSLETNERGKRSRAEWRAKYLATAKAP